MEKRKEINIDDILGAAIMTAVLNAEAKEKVMAAAMAGKEKQAQPERDNIRAAARELGFKVNEALLGFMEAGIDEDKAFTLIIEKLKGEF